MVGMVQKLLTVILSDVYKHKERICKLFESGLAKD